MPSNQLKNMSWFPGHMKKATDEIKKSLHIVDLVIEIGDSRAPYSSLNTTLDKIIGDKKKVILFSKRDLADTMKIDFAIKRYKEEKGVDALSLDFKSKEDIRRLISYLSSIKTTKSLKYERFGMAVPPLRAIIIGIPNVGKSTLINSLLGKKKANVANKPGLTRTQQLVKIDNRFELFDTPGILQPNYEDKNAIMKLAYLGSISDEAIPIEEVYSSLGTFLLDNYKDEVYSHYSIDKKIQLNMDNLFTEIALSRKFLLPKNEPDIQRAKIAFLKEFRAGEITKCVVDDVNA